MKLAAAVVACVLAASSALAEDIAAAGVAHRFAVTLETPVQAPAINSMHSRVVRVSDLAGKPIADAQIGVAGELKAIGRALPTAPQVTRYLGEGRYVIDGIKFNMTGTWLLSLSIDAASQADTATLEITVPTPPSMASMAIEWSHDELDAMRSLSLGSLPPLRPDPSNPVADDPRAVALGHRLFFDRRLSANGKVACASCHKPELFFTDGLEISEGIGQTIRNAPTLVGIAYSPWFFWDGRKDSLWSQALGPLENPAEHGMNRTAIIDIVRADPDYAQRYEELFGPLPNPADAAAASLAFANLGRTIAAYERKLLPGASKFDRYAEAVLKGIAPAPGDRLSLDEVQGLRAFMADNQGKCMRCHNGPLFTDDHFHNIGADKAVNRAEDRGRFEGIKLAATDEFNCLGAFSGAPASACAELRFAKRDTADLLGAFKTPTLRNLPKTGPYMHRGQYERLDLAVRHYDAVPFAAVGKSELEKTTLTASQFDQIRVFLLTLQGSIAAPERLLLDPHR